MARGIGITIIGLNCTRSAVSWADSGQRSLGEKGRMGFTNHSLLILASRHRLLQDRVEYILQYGDPTGGKPGLTERISSAFGRYGLKKVID